MAANKDAQVHRIDRRLTQIKGQIKQEQDFQEFGATSDLDYRMSGAKIKGLVTERENLKEIRGDL